MDKYRFRFWVPLLNFQADASNSGRIPGTSHLFRGLFRSSSGLSDANLRSRSREELRVMCPARQFATLPFEQFACVLEAYLAQLCPVKKRGDLVDALFFVERCDAGDHTSFFRLFGDPDMMVGRSGYLRQVGYTYNLMRPGHGLEFRTNRSRNRTADAGCPEFIQFTIFFSLSYLRLCILRWTMDEARPNATPKTTPNTTAKSRISPIFSISRLLSMLV